MVIASVYSMRSNGLAMNASMRVMASGVTRSAKNAMSSPRSSSTALKIALRNASAQSASADRSANAISGSTIQNSVK